MRPVLLQFRADSQNAENHARDGRWSFGLQRDSIIFAMVPAG